MNLYKQAKPSLVLFVFLKKCLAGGVRVLAGLQKGKMAKYPAKLGK
jgi:hypothetical protein